MNKKFLYCFVKCVLVVVMLFSSFILIGCGEKLMEVYLEDVWVYV